MEMGVESGGLAWSFSDKEGPGRKGTGVVCGVWEVKRRRKRHCSNSFSHNILGMFSLFELETACQVNILISAVPSLHICSHTTLLLLLNQSLKHHAFIGRIHNIPVLLFWLTLLRWTYALSPFLLKVSCLIWKLSSGYCTFSELQWFKF